MKKTLLSSLILASSVVVSSAVTSATVRNFSSFTNGLPTLDNTGTPISGSYAVGYFADDFDFLQDGTAVRDGFNIFGSELNTFVFTGLIGTPNSTSDTIDKDGSSPFSGKDVYVLFGDQGTLADSGLFGVFKVAGQFQDENAADLGTAAADVFPGNGEVVYGNVIAPLSQPPENGSLSFSQGLQLVAVGVIPEPSTGLLTALAGLALVARRRR